MSNGRRYRRRSGLPDGWRPFLGGSVEVGQVIAGDGDGNEYVVEGEEGEALRDLMRSHCPICAAESEGRRD